MSLNLVLECAEWCILPNGNFRDLFLWRRGGVAICVFEKRIPGSPERNVITDVDHAVHCGPVVLMSTSAASSLRTVVSVVYTVVYIFLCHKFALFCCYRNFKS